MPEFDRSTAPAPRRDASPARPGSILDYLTDGTLAALCRELSEFSGLGVSLHDPSWRRVSAAEGRGWVVGEPEPPAPGSTRIPLTVHGNLIGTIVLGAGTPSIPPDARPGLELALGLLAKTASEFCAQEDALQHRVMELGALARLANLLTRATSGTRILEIALESALDVLGLDAGSMVMLPEDSDGRLRESEVDLELVASRNLSDDWLHCPTPLSRGRLFDTLALRGEVVVSEDLARDERVLIADRAEAEGLGAFINAGLIFRDRPLGVIRLYARSPRAFSESDRRVLRSIAEQAAVAVEQARLLKIKEQDERLQRQIELAADVQRRMLPRGAPKHPRFDAASRYVPSFELGGDFYDFIDLHGHFGIVVGDVVGKGVAAALLMAAVRASLRAHAQSVYDVDDILSRVNVAIASDTRDNEFASVWYGVIDPSSLRLTFCSAGHDPPMVVRAPGNRVPAADDVHELDAGGMVIGIDATQRYQRGVYDLHPGDVLVASTDGVTDTMDFSRRKFGRARLRDAVLTALGKDARASASAILEHVFWELRQHAGLSERIDDQTLVVIRVRQA